MLAQQIVHRHSARFAGFAPQPIPSDINTDAGPSDIWQAALYACSQLGFAQADAQCLADAWHAQTLRNGQFDASCWPTHAADFGVRGRGEMAFAPCPQRLGLYAVLPTAQWVGRMAAAGVPTVQLRFKSDDAAAVRAEVFAAVQAVQGTAARLFINDHWELALEAGAYGVHLGQEDLDALPPAALERMRSAGVRLGVSTHGYAEMLRADRVAPSYIALGAVFPTTLKKMATPPQGVGRLGVYAQLMQNYPLVAIGGIGPEQMADVLATGVGSVGVVRALVNHPEPEAQAQQLAKAIGCVLP